MDNFYLLLLLVSLVALVLGLYKPSVVRLSSRKLVFLVFGGTAAIFFMLFGLNISSSSPAVSVVAAPVVTATSTPPSPVALYATAMQTSVLPFLESADQDIIAASNVGGAGDLSTALQDAQGAQKTILKAKAGFAAVQPAPAPLVQANSLVGKAIDSFSRAIDEMVTGLQNQNASTIRDAEAYLTQGDAYTTQASALMEKVNAK